MEFSHTLFIAWSRGNPGDACWQMLLGALRPQTTPEDKKVTNSQDDGFAGGLEIQLTDSLWLTEVSDVASCLVLHIPRCVLVRIALVFGIKESR